MISPAAPPLSPSAAIQATAPRAVPSAEQPSLSPWVACVLVAAVYSIPLFAAIRPIADWDIWWHLRVGQWITEHSWVTQTDPFSAYGADRSWVAYSWLFELLVFKLYQALGLSGVLLCRILLALAVVAGCHRLAARREPRFLMSTLMAGVAALVLSPLMSERPWLFTILFTTLTLEVILDLREGKRGPLFWVLPLLYVLWANLHIQFVYGFLLLGIGCSAPILDRLLGRPNSSEDAGSSVFLSPDWWRLVGLTAACVLATLVNPYHIRLYGVVLEYATQPGPFRVVNELMALTFRDTCDWLVLGLALGTAFALGRKARLSSFDIMLFAASALLCFRARRDLWMIVLAALTILPPGRKRDSGIGRKRSLPVSLSPCLLVFLLAVLLWRGKGLTEERLRQEEARDFPARACEEVVRRGYSGRLYNHFNWGGYLIWKLPRLQVSIDGRTNLHGEQRIDQSLRTWRGILGWHDDPELAAAQVVLIDADSALASLLRLDRRYELIYEDERAAVFVPSAVAQKHRMSSSGR